MLNNLAAANGRRWNAMAVNPNAITGLDRVARRLIAAKARYQAVEAKTGVPWPVIAVIHEREASQSWMANLAQGDRWDRVSTHIPRGQGPFRSWEEAAINALNHSAPFLGRNKDWSMGMTLAQLEAYNGLGYSNKGRPSPYVWAKTNQYRSGKYVADGVYDANAVDTQDGCAALLKRMMYLDTTIKYWGASSAPSVKSAVTPGGATAAVAASGATAAAVHLSPYANYEMYIIPAVLVTALVGFLVYRFFKKES